MDYRIFNVHVYVIILMHAYVHTRRFGTPTVSQHNISDSEKLTNFVCAPDEVQTPGRWILSTTNSATPFVAQRYIILLLFMLLWIVQLIVSH